MVLRLCSIQVCNNVLPRQRDDGVLLGEDVLLRCPLTFVVSGTNTIESFLTNGFECNQNEERETSFSLQRELTGKAPISNARFPKIQFAAHHTCRN